ncbi:DUF4190 domain-containing protein [Demequina globuliformis]|uniref:DUF4190 domain-containing protein n=1 Tax=Demequina globuliformis TaxID=676202 RepID=UPI000782ED7F|nr:DUF4190 domain-containing protein [Demequina globuliformis]
MDNTQGPAPEFDGESMPTRRELREQADAATRNDLGVSGPDAAGVEGQPPAVDGDTDTAAVDIDEIETGPAERAVVDGEPTEVFDPVVDGDAQPTAVMDPVGDDADRAHEAHDSAETPGEPGADKNWMGVSAFVAALLALSPVAIILGHLGLSAAKKGEATNRPFALAGAVLGWIALVATGVGVWFYLQGPVPAQVDVQAQQDIHAVGAEVATQVVATDALPVLADSGSEYTVGDVTIASELETSHEVTLTGTAPADWCLDLTYEGGENAAYSYLPTQGVVEGAC